MTKMTVLHFASPFSVSMPVHAATRGPRSPATVARENAATAAEGIADDETSPIVSGADSVSWLAMDAPVEPMQGHAAAAGVLDRVRRRYAEQSDLSDDTENDENDHSD